MAVLQHNRTTSQMEFYQNAERIYDAVMDYILREFGKKKKIFKFEVADKKIELSDEDKEIINAILEKNNLDRKNFCLSRRIPKEIIERDQEILFNECEKMISYIVTANSIYPESVLEFMFRELYFKKAKACCFVLKNKLIRIIRYYKLSFNTIEQLIKFLDTERTLIDGVMNSDKRKFKDFYEEYKRVKADNNLFTDEEIKTVNDIFNESLISEILEAPQLSIN